MHFCLYYVFNVLEIVESPYNTISQAKVRNKSKTIFKVEHKYHYQYYNISVWQTGPSSCRHTSTICTSSTAERHAGGTCRSSLQKREGERVEGGREG